MESSQPKHLSPWIAWSLVALFAGIALFTTWYYYSEASTAYDNSVNFFGLNVHHNKTATTTTTSSTANWKTYTSDFGYSIKYPSTITQSGNSATVDFKQASLPILDISTKATTKTLTQILSEQSTIFTNTQATKLAGTDAYEGIGAGLTSTYDIYAVKNGYLYILSFDTNNSNTLASLKAAMTSTETDMLSTFQFTQ